MAKIKFSKGELKRQRDGLAQFRHYLPTLQLKKQQLQIKIYEIREQLEKKKKALAAQETHMEKWLKILADPGVDVKPWILPRKILTDTMNIAGVNIPLFKEAEFAPIDYDYYATPLWVDKAVEHLRQWIRFMVEVGVIQKQIQTLEQELRITTQRVNLFEKIKIPECLENIRKIRIYLGDQQANAVGISKVAKKKIGYTMALEEIGV